MVSPEQNFATVFSPRISDPGRLGCGGMAVSLPCVDLKGEETYGSES